jgi:hypothetical protein
MLPEQNRGPYAPKLSDRPLDERIEHAFDERARILGLIEQSRSYINRCHAHAKAELGEEYTTAKNGDVREVLVQEFLEDDVDYWQEVTELETQQFYLTTIDNEISKLRLLVAYKEACFEHKKRED